MIATGFQFDCPACRGRLSITALERGGLISCSHCGVDLPAPCFHVDSREDRPPRVFQRRDYTCHCPHCGAPRAVMDVGHEVECESCGQLFTPPAAPWLQWLRPVARVLTDEDQARSLHHLIGGTDRVWMPDEVLEDREKQRFSFYCGACGRLQTARVWDIATQRACSACQSLMIIPAPHGAQVVPTQPAADRADETPARREVLYCPRCGTRCPNADRSRVRRTYCAACDHWF
ncbi:MAG: hypothetical protein D6744_17575 [Planctomycetota bacterium]|nr:MAG: hypothetical protein D6744_17575 [Planctomycetota bacterium]